MRLRRVMCGRYTLTSCENFDPTDFGLSRCPPEIPPRYNIAPTQAAPVIPNRVPREVAYFRFGLVPSWARDTAIASRCINARAETLSERPAFRDAFRRRRCLVLADGFYEWRREGRLRVPYRFRRRDGRVFAFAGLWETWRSREGASLRTFAIITVSANALVAPVHDRMPVILPSEAFDSWLDPGPVDPRDLTPWLIACPEDLLEAYEVSPLVNSTTRDEPALIEPVRRLLP